MICKKERTANSYPRCHSREAPSRPGRRWLLLWHLSVGFLSLVWLIVRVGTKPSRIQYPCQRVAAPLASGFIIYAAGMVSSLLVCSKYRILIRKMSRRAAVACLCLGVLAVVGFLGVQVKDALGISDPVHTHSPIGTGTPTVVSVYDENVTNWGGEAYYWDYVSQSTVDTMMAQAITAMTGTVTTNQAWQDILPSYSSGDTIAIKVNFNNGGAEDLNSLPQPVVALVNQLKQFGFAASEIYVYDTSRRISSSDPISIHTFFRDTVESTGANIVDSNTPDRWSTNMFTTYSSVHGTRSTEHAGLLDDVDYLINLPIMKEHGVGGVTFGFKNHYGSIHEIIFSSDGAAPLHDGIRQDHQGYSDTGVPLVELNSLPVIRDKTVLVVGDAIYSYGGWVFDPITHNPEVIFMSKDPVAVESVMFDYFHSLIRSREVWHQDYLHLAAQAGLGVHDHYPYSQINYVELNGDNGTYVLTVNVVGAGSVNRDPAPPYYPDDVVTLTAIPAADWTFSGWSGAVTGSTNPTSVTMDNHKSVTATFTEDPPDPQVHVRASYFIEEGDTWTARAVVRYLVGTIEYQWSKLGVGDLPGETGPSMTIDPVADGDEGYYQVEVWVGSGDHIQSPPRFVDVVPIGTIPVTGALGLSVLAVSCVLAGAVAVRRKNR